MLRVSCPSGSGREGELTTSLASRISRSLLIKAFSAASALFFQMVTSDSLPDSKLRILCRWCKQHKTPHHSHPPPPTSPVTGHPHSHTYLTLTLTCHPSPSHITSHPLTLILHIQTHHPHHHSPPHVIPQPHTSPSPLLLLLYLTLQLSHFSLCRQERVLQLQRRRGNWMKYVAAQCIGEHPNASLVGEASTYYNA